MEPELQFSIFSRIPFAVEAVQVTEENMAAIAHFVGELKTKEDGTPFILVNRRLVPNLYRVFTGYWMTRMGDNIRCYSDKVFQEQFTPRSYEWVVTTTNELATQLAEEGVVVTTSSNIPLVIDND